MILATYTASDGSHHRAAVFGIAGNGSNGTVIHLLHSKPLVLVPSFSSCPVHVCWTDRAGNRHKWVKPPQTRDRTIEEKRLYQAEMTRRWYGRHAAEINLRAAQRRTKARLARPETCRGTRITKTREIV